MPRRIAPGTRLKTVATAAATMVAVVAGPALAGPAAATGDDMEAADIATATETPIVPRPVLVDQRAQAEPFTLSGSSRVWAVDDARPVGKQLIRLLRRSTGERILPTDREQAADIRIDVDPASDYTVDGAEPTEESYVLDVTEDGVDIVARTAHGAFNAVQTLRQLLPAWVNSPRAVTTDWRVPAIHVEDAPRFAYRGVMLDVARSFQDVEAVKHYIDTLSQLKMSVLHLHLADDQGWRIEISNEGREPGDTIDYTRLTDISGGTAMNERGYRDELGRTGYYTQEEYRDIVEYAADRFVTVVPEVDTPSHTNAALHALPKLNTGRSLPAKDPETGVVDWNGTARVGYSALDERHEPTYQFMRHVFSQLAEMTEGPYVHIGGDESHAMGHERYVDFVTRAVPDVREATGVGVMGWTEYAEAGLDSGPGYWDGSVIQYWVGSGDWVRDFIAKGGKAVVSAAGGAYLDQKYDPSTPIGLSWACSGDCDFPRYYSWDPTTTVSGGVPEDGVLGVEGPLWSETVRGEDQAFYLTLPRAAAILETGWTAADRKDIDGFAQRLGALGAHWTTAGTNFYESRRATWSATVAGTDVTVRPGDASAHEIGLVAAPGTKASADRSQLAPDRVTSDGDPASDSTLTEPLTATLDCGSERLPVTFTSEQPRDNLHGAGVYTASVRHAFDADTTCTLTPSVGEPVDVEISVSPGGDGGGGNDSPSGPARITVGSDGGAVDAGTWVPFELKGFGPDDYVEIAIDGDVVYTVHTDEDGRFDRHALIPASTYDGVRTVTAAQGALTARTRVQVDSDVKPLPDIIDQSTLRVHDVSSEETEGEDGAATNAIDGDPGTFWHTQWYAAEPPYPHHITIDLGQVYDVTGLQYQQRQNASNGRMKDYEVSVSTDGVTWSDPVASGQFTDDTIPQNVEFAATPGRYVRLTGLSSINGNVFGGAAEINIGGLSR